MQYTTEAKAQIAGEYVLGLAPRPLARAVRRRMRRDPELAGLVNQWQQSLHELGQAMPVSQPVGAQVWARIAAELPDGPAATATVNTAGRPTSPIAGAPAAIRKWWQQLWVWQGWAVAASALALVFGLQPQLTSSLTEPYPAPLMEDVAEPSVPAAPNPVATSVPGLETAPIATTASGTAAEAALPSARVRADEAVVPAGSAAGRPATGGATAGMTTGGMPTGGMATGGMATAGTTAAGSVATVASATPVIRSTRELETADAAPETVARTNVGRSRDGRTRSASDTVSATSSALVGVLMDGGTGGAAWLVRWDQQTETLRVRVLAHQSAGPARDFELWAVPPDGGPPKAIGLISGTRDSALLLDRELARSLRMAQVLAVSIEPAGGSPAAGPTGPVKFTGALQQI